MAVATKSARLFNETLKLPAPLIDHLKFEVKRNESGAIMPMEVLGFKVAGNDNEVLVWDMGKCAPSIASLAHQPWPIPGPLDIRVLASLLAKYPRGVLFSDKEVEKIARVPQDGNVRNIILQSGKTLAHRIKERFGIGEWQPASLRTHGIAEFSVHDAHGFNFLSAMRITASNGHTSSYFDAKNLPKYSPDTKLVIYISSSHSQIVTPWHLTSLLNLDGLIQNPLSKSDKKKANACLILIDSSLHGIAISAWKFIGDAESSKIALDKLQKTLAMAAPKETDAEIWAGIYAQELPKIAKNVKIEV